MARYTWGNVVRIKSDAGREYRPGSLVSVCGIRRVDTPELEAEFQSGLGSWIYLIEYPDGNSIEVPESILEQPDRTTEATATNGNTTSTQGGNADSNSGPVPWIGRLEAEPLAGNNVLDGAKGAIVNAVGLATSAESFSVLLSGTMREHGFRIVAMNSVHPWEAWKRGNVPHPDLERLVRELTAEFPVQFDEFQSFDEG